MSESHGSISESLQRYSWSNQAEFGVARRETCRCEHPYTARSINRDGLEWGGYRVEAGDAPQLSYTVALLEPDADRSAGVCAAVRFWIGFRPPSLEAHGFMVHGGEIEGADGTVVTLDREQALAHARIADAWELIDWLFVTDPMMHQVMGHGQYPTARNWPGLALRDDHAPRPRWPFRWRR